VQPNQAERAGVRSLELADLEVHGLNRFGQLQFEDSDRKVLDRFVHPGPERAQHWTPLAASNRRRWRRAVL
jgi:hypothetical protein